MKHAGFLTLALVLTHLLFQWMGLGFDARPLSAGGAWQLLSPELLQSDLWRSVFYLHAQPPLFNLWVGLGHHLGGVLFFSLSQLLLVCIGCLLFADLLQQLIPSFREHPRYALGCAYGLGISPPVLLYSHWFFYSQWEWFLVILTAWFALRKSYHGFVMTLGALVFLRSAFAPIYYALVILGALVFIQPFRSRSVLSVSAILILGMGGWCVKNNSQVGVLGTSSWLGMNWSRWIREAYPEQSWPKSVRMGAFRDLSQYETAYPELLPLSQNAPIHPALRDGFNHEAYAATSAIFSREIKALLIHDLTQSPFQFAGHILHGWYRAGHLFFSSTVDQDLLRENRERIRPWHLLWKNLFFPFGLRLFSVGSFVLALALAYRLRKSDLLFAGWSAFTLVFLLGVFITFEYGENNRFRYPLTPLTLLASVYYVVEWITIWKSRSSRLG